MLAARPRPGLAAAEQRGNAVQLKQRGGDSHPARVSRLSTAVRRAALCAFAMVCAACGQHEGPGEVTQASRPVAPAAGAKQILFGDLHAHTTFSLDAFAISLPLLGGEGAHPPADACDYARFCAALDFWSINDHAEGLTPRHWRETQQALRDCNAAADAANPDLVSFLGWEWTQVGGDAASHYGHRNVVLRDMDGANLPRRPIAAPRAEFQRAPVGPLARWLMPLADFANRQRIFNWFHRFEEIAAVPHCPQGVPTRALPDDCLEIARNPAELFEKLDGWGAAALVIPHGTTWGLNAPPRANWRPALRPGQHDPARETLIEVYSGHGSAEEYRPWRAAALADEAFCPLPDASHLPCCWRAGEIVRARCEAEGGADCETRAAAARENYIAAGVAGHNTVPGATVADWLDCGQCRDCFAPAMDHRPGMSVQAALSQTGAAGARLRFGLIASSDTHRARPGNGFKERGRGRITDATSGGRSWGLRGGERPVARSRRVVLEELPLSQRRYTERQASFYGSGGLVAVHAAGRTRGDIFAALERREAYGSSGPRILLWFNLLNAPGGALPMGGETALAEAPRFRAAAVGARMQQPGCPASARDKLGAARLSRLCADECHHPGDSRHRIAAIEVVRIRPRQSEAESPETPETLIEDPWLRFDCTATASGAAAAATVAEGGCTFEFSDPDFTAAARETAYYVRALQFPTPAINGDPLRCERDAAGRCLRAHPCPPGDDCLAPIAERAWSSPIWIHPPRAQ